MHESGHALGLSDAIVGENAKEAFNEFRPRIHDFIREHLSSRPGVDIFGATIAFINDVIDNSMGDLPERAYEVSHPTIADSVMIYDSERDCWPHPFDIMAVNSIYQVDY